MPPEVLVRVPVRVLDAGGWTDTWFAGRGLVCHVAVQPGVEVRARATPLAPGQDGAVELSVDDGPSYRFDPDRLPGRHPLLEAAVRHSAPRGYGVQASVASAVPPGSSLGTSAAVVVALISALAVLAGDPPDRPALARAAHEVETVDLGMQSGVQDQLAAVWGGASLITVDPYPEARVQPLRLAPATWQALERRMITVYLGRPHRSGAIHEQVIARLEKARSREALLDPLRRAAGDAATALVTGDLAAYGEAMVANTRAQEALHPDLISAAAEGVIAVASRHGAVGWKVNGAGGDGGSVTVIGPEDPAALIAALGELAGLSLLPLRPDHGGGLTVEPG